MSALALAVLAVPLALQAVALLRRPAPERPVMGMDVGRGDGPTSTVVVRIEADGKLRIVDMLTTHAAQASVVGDPWAGSTS